MIWTAFFILFGVAFFLILWKERDLKYILYWVFGALFGFLFDISAVALGYYKYILLFQILGAPVTITIAEGFCIAITIYIFEKLIKPRI